jgi:hypothetical protein
MEESYCNLKPGDKIQIFEACTGERLDAKRKIQPTSLVEAVRVVIL